LEGADAKMGINEWASAIESYEFVITNWPDSEAAAAAANNKGVCLLALGRYDEAIKILEPLAATETLCPYVLPNLARCWAKKGEAEKARNAMRLLIAQTGETAEAIAAQNEVERYLAESASVAI